MPDLGYDQLVREAYEAFRQQDSGPLMALLTDDVEWIDPLPDDHPVGGTLHGKAAVRDYFSKLSDLAEFQALDVLDTIASGNQVVALIHLENTMLHNNRSFAGDSAHVWTFRDGLACRYRIFADTERIMTAFRA